jgi:DNA topoisomerase VI subunit B
MSATATRTTFSTSRLLEFCSRKELVAQTGHEPDAWPLVIIKECVDNSLDSAEESGVAPVIHVTVARGKMRVRDNGPGIPAETVTSIQDFATRTSSREAYVAPDRGRQGNALKTIIAMPYALSGEEGRVEIAARGIQHEIAFRVDRIAQQPVINHQQHQLDEASVRTGTSVTLLWPESACSDLEDAEQHFLPMIERFAHLNPHLTIYATWVDGWRRERLTRRATAPGWTKWTPSAPTCPHWYRRAEFERLLGAFLTHDRRYNSVRLIRDFLAEFNGLSGTAKRKSVLDAVGLQRAPLERLLNGGMEFDHDLVDALLAAMQAEARPIKPDGLGALGKDNVARGFERCGADLTTYRYKILKGVTDGIPWVAEAAFACRTKESQRLLLSGINWSPTLRVDGDPFSLSYQLGSSWCGHAEPIVLLAHLICPRPEFLDRGKSTLARHSPGFDAVPEVVEHVTQDWAKQRRSEIRNKALEEKRAEKMRVEQRAPVLSLKDLVLKHLPAVIKQISENGRLSFTQRDVFYALRPLVQQAHEKSLNYGYFTALITDYENECGEIKGMQREPRGTLYHPHLRQEIPLSTETVAKYGRPFWTFNKVVYIEKAGTQQNLIETGWPEEYDCAIASVAGFTTRAVKDLFDLLATSSEPVMVFCVHDADAAGTMIYHTLQNETKARGARKIQVINLGLEPWEGVKMGLEIEPVEGTDRRRAVAPYVDEYDPQWRSWLESRRCDSWEEWLQEYRIELNAMPPAQRIAWLTEKIERHPPRKVEPPAHVLHAARVGAARDAIIDELTERARIEERANEILAGIEWPDRERLPKVVSRFLNRKRQRKNSWRRPMTIAGEKQAKRALPPPSDNSNGAGGTV